MFLSQLQDLIWSEQIQIILGDFNADAFGSDIYASLWNSVERYSTIVRGPAYLSESVIDHVYLSNTTLDKFQATATTKNIYFSNQDAGNLELRSFFFSEKSRKPFYVVSLIAD